MSFLLLLNNPSSRTFRVITDGAGEAFDIMALLFPSSTDDNTGRALAFFPLRPFARFVRWRSRAVLAPCGHLDVEPNLFHSWRILYNERGSWTPKTPIFHSDICNTASLLLCRLESGAVAIGFNALLPTAEGVTCLIRRVFDRNTRELLPLAAVDLHVVRIGLAP